eukprot:6492803-Amphidinium_carterae.3
MQSSSIVRTRAAKQLEKGEKNQHLADCKAINELMRTYPSCVAVMLSAGLRATRGKQPEVESVSKARSALSLGGTQDMEAESLAANAALLQELEKPMDRRSDHLMAQSLNSLKALLTYLEPLALSPFNIKGLAGKHGSGQVSKQSITRVIEFLCGVKGKQEFGKCFPTLKALADNLAILNKQRGRLVRHLVTLPPTWSSMGVYRIVVDTEGATLTVQKVTTHEEKSLSLESVGLSGDKPIVVENNWSESEAHLRQDGNLRNVSLFAVFPQALTFTTPAKRRKTPAVLDGACSAREDKQLCDGTKPQQHSMEDGEKLVEPQEQQKQQQDQTVKASSLVQKEEDCLMAGVDIPVDLFSSDDEHV